MIFRFIILFFLLLVVTQMFSQSTFTVYNDGLAVTKLEAGLTATIVGNFVSQTNVTDGQIDNQSTIQVSGNWTNNNSTSNVFSTQAGEIELNGSSAQILNGSRTTSFNNIIINNSSTGITCSIETKIDGNLTLTDGIIYTTSANTLTIEDNATSTSGSNASFVDGPMKKIGNDNFDFPVGNGTKWARVGVDNSLSLNTNTEFTAQYVRVGHGYRNVDVSLNKISFLEYWSISRAINADNADVSLYWTNATESDITDWTSADLVVARYNGVSWTDEGQGSVSSGKVKSGAPVSDFSNLFFTFGSKGGSNPLPIELLEFDAQKLNNDVEVIWTTTSEINNDFFKVERSSDGVNFYDIGTVNGAGNSNMVLNYSFIDYNHLEGISYYRLTQVDFNGDFSKSEIVAINFQSERENNIVAFPNPSNGNVFVQLSGLEENKKVLVVLTDIFGRELYTKIIITNVGINTFRAINADDKLPIGTYFIIASQDNNLYRKKLIIIE